MYNYYSSSPTVTNCILWGNAASSGQEIYNYDGASSPEVVYSCVAGSYAGEGNIDADPLFVGAPYSVQLRDGSPCIDFGTSLGAPDTDILGRLRPVGLGVDMGAYEGGVALTDIVSLSMYANPSLLGETSPPVGVHSYVRDEVAVLSAHNTAGIFTHWEGDASGNEPNTTVLMNDDKVVTAVFVALDPLLVDADGETYVTKPAGESATFAVVVSGDVGPLSYQWYRITNDKALTLIPDAIESSYTLFDISEADEGDYQCEVYDHGRDETAWSPVFTLVLGASLPASGLLGLTLAALATAIAGTSILKKRRNRFSR